MTVTRSATTLLAALAMLALGACGSSSTKTTRSTASTPAGSGGSNTATIPSREIAAGTVSASSGSVAATMRAATHNPHVQVPWPLTFTVTNAGRPAHASVAYEYLFAGQVVAHRSHYLFTGRFSDVFHWPAAAVGYPLTFRAVIRSAGHTVNLDYPVQVVR
ncbi:MAG TPA: hypothetical protein VMG62_02990 [Solirubrobacteraceae bacterium]|nr:hypothetical protein [Solirubrobacteraceae bacterium]